MPTLYFRSSALAEQSRERGPSGSTLSLSLSDIPKSLTAEVAPKERTLLIRFDYPDREPAIQRDFDGVTVSIGKHSGKVLAFLIIIPHQPVYSALWKKITSAMQNDAMRAPRDNQRLHYQLISHLLESPQVQDTFTQLLSAKL